MGQFVVVINIERLVRSFQIIEGLLLDEKERGIKPYRSKHRPWQAMFCPFPTTRRNDDGTGRSLSCPAQHTTVCRKLFASYYTETASFNNNTNEVTVLFDRCRKDFSHCSFRGTASCHERQIVFPTNKRPLFPSPPHQFDLHAR